MNKTKNLLATLLLLLTLGAFAAGLWFGGAYFVRLAGSGWFSGVDPVILLALAVAFSALAIASSHRWMKRQAAESQTREARRGVYESAVLAWQGALRIAQEQGGAITSRLPDDIHSLEIVLASRASSTVLRHYVQLRQFGSQPDPSLQQIQDQLCTLFVEIRHELGVGGYRPEERTIVRSFLMNFRTENGLEILPTRPEERQSSSFVAAARPAFSLSK